MANKERYTPKQVIEALQSADGYVSRAAYELKCTPKTVYEYKKRYPEIAEEWDAIREKRHDYVENALHKQIKSGNIAAIIFYLKTQAKPRGYVERQEWTGADGGAVQIKRIVEKRG